MAGSYTDNGDGTSTLSFQFTADTQNMIDTLDAAAHMLYVYATESPDHGLPDWDTLTMQQKLDYLDARILARVRTLADGYYHHVREEEARQLAEQDGSTII